MVEVQRSIRTNLSKYLKSQKKPLGTGRKDKLKEESEYYGLLLTSNIEIPIINMVT